MITNIITATITAYCSCKLCCGKWSAHGLTANGTPPIQGITIAASRKYPLGSKCIIDGHTYTIQDRLAKKYDSRFDVYFNNHKEALKWGKQTKQVTIYETH